MMKRAQRTGSVKIRVVEESDLPIFYVQQLDPDATAMADFPSREQKAFMAHWTRIMSNETNVIRTILFDGQVVGNIVSFDQDGKREVGYWLGKEFWCRGIATIALMAFLEIVKTRPLYAHIVKDNLGSRRVLEKCGFTLSGEDREFSSLRGVEVEEVLLKLG